jgi:hypothetical protein
VKTKRRLGWGHHDAYAYYVKTQGLAGTREAALDALHGEAHREGWARDRVAAEGKSWATHMAKFDGTVLPRGVDWDDYRACSQVCRAPMGKPCFSLSGRVVNGHTDGVITVLNVPHNARKLRTRAWKVRVS